jgi:hypothetical protein
MFNCLVILTSLGLQMKKELLINVSIRVNVNDLRLPWLSWPRIMPAVSPGMFTMFPVLAILQ